MYPSSRIPRRNALMFASFAVGEPADIQPIRATFVDCCALARAGQMLAEAVTILKKSRRRMYVSRTVQGRANFEHVDVGDAALSNERYY
jgi:hypothetical protein